MWSFLDKMITGVSMIEGNSSISTKKNLNEKIANCAQRAFVDSIINSSIPNEKMMFERIIIVNLHPDDYTKSRTFFYGINDIIINRFYNVINQYLKKYNNDIDKSFKDGWTLKYLVMEQVEKGNPTATTENPIIIREKLNNGEVIDTDNIQPTITAFNSKGKAINIKTEVFLNCPEREDGVFGKIEFDESRIVIDEHLSKKKMQQFVNFLNINKSPTKAKLTYNLGNGIQTCNMKTDQIEICGKNIGKNKRGKKAERCILNVDLSPPKYAKIFCEDLGFKIGTYGKLNVNNNEIRTSADRKMPRYTLPNGSIIKLQTVAGKEISIKFESLI